MQENIYETKSETDIFDGLWEEEYDSDDDDNWDEDDD